jgi:hypothetical protein
MSAASGARSERSSTDATLANLIIVVSEAHPLLFNRCLSGKGDAVKSWRVESTTFTHRPAARANWRSLLTTLENWTVTTLEK